MGELRIHGGYPKNQHRPRQNPLLEKEGNCVRPVDGFLFRRAVGHSTGYFRNLSDPTTVRLDFTLKFDHFANSFFTNSLTSFPSTLNPAALNLAIAFFITVPISFMVGDPISAIAARTPAATSSSPAALGR